MAKWKADAHTRRRGEKKVMCADCGSTTICARYIVAKRRARSTDSTPKTRRSPPIQCTSASCSSCCSPRSRTLARLGRSDGSITSPRPAVAAAVANISVRTGTGAVLMRAPRLGRMTATRRTCQCCSTRTPTSSARFQPGRAHACRKASLGPTTRCRRARPLDSHAAVSSSRIWVGVCDVMWCTHSTHTCVLL